MSSNDQSDMGESGDGIHQSPPRRKEDLRKAKYADLDIHEGDERGKIFFGEFESRKILTTSMDRAWSELLAAGCTSCALIESYEAADRCKIVNAEMKAFEGLLRFGARDVERIRLGHAEYSYVNFLSTGYRGGKQEAQTAVSADSSPIKHRRSVALTAFHRDLIDLQDLAEVAADEMTGRLAIVTESFDQILSLSISCMRIVPFAVIQ